MRLDNLRCFSTGAIVLAIVALASNVSAQEQKMCHRLFQTGFNFDVIRGCNPGDILVAQISSNVAPAAIVGRLCDFHFSIFSERHPASQEMTIACVLVNDRQPRN